VIKRIAALIIAVYLLGFVWFSVDMPEPVTATKVDGIVVLTGAKGRLQRGINLMKSASAKRMLVSGVDTSVRRREFDAVHNVPAELSACCIDLGRESVDTISNGRETAAWVSKYQFKTILLVTNDWHMRRARFELERELGKSVVIIPDAVKTGPSLFQLFKEYNKYLARRISVLFGA
jgi:uncharacterized SAM-binding protein YcdF (DUF218 family)